MLRVVFAGLYGVGKTSLVQRLQRGSAPETDVRTTVGAAFGQVHVVRRGEKVEFAHPALNEIKGSEQWDVHIWDTAGQERFESLGPIYFREADVVIVVHDGTPRSQNKAAQLVKDLHQRANGPPLIQVWQNKADQTHVSESVEWHGELKTVHNIETARVSARTGENVNAAFLDVVAQCIARRNPEAMHESVRLAAREGNLRPKSRCWLW